jgi:hypothetical protein
MSARRGSAAGRPARTRVVIHRALAREIRVMIEAARERVAREVNAGLTALHWQIGARVRQDILKNRRATYGQEILPTLSAKLVPEFGRGYSARNLARMVALAEAFPDGRVFAALVQRLGWSHFVEILSIGDP